MPKRTDIKSILIIGAGPIVIGQACEFDYSGTQACKALKAEGYRIVLVNSNPATIMTDPELADATYVEPITPDIVAKIIEKERPDALLPTMGGQTALNTALALDKQGVLAAFGVEMIGAKAEAIDMAEDRQRFREAMSRIGLATPRSKLAQNRQEALAALEHVGLPAIIRPSFTLGGTGGGVAYNREEFLDVIERGLDASPTHQVLVEESVLGWKEFEMEVVRDTADNCIIVCSIENVDPMGVHTGDSITVAPALTLTDKEYQIMRNASIAVLREIGVETGGSNVQFAVNPADGRLVVIEMNPRVSRSSALASKATGFPIAKVAARLAVGYTLDELENDITGGATPASFEPTIDYVVTKIPRFAFEKFPGADPTLTTSMKSVGEVMAIGRTFEESLQKALRSLETGLSGLDDVAFEGLGVGDDKNAIRAALGRPTPDRILKVAQAMRLGVDHQQINASCGIDPWFLARIQSIVDTEQRVLAHGLPGSSASFRALKAMGFSDARLARLASVSEAEVRSRRHALGVRPVFKRIDTCAAEFASPTAYMYSTYERGLVLSETGDKNVLSETGDKNVLSETGDKNVLSETGDKNVLSETGDKNVLSETGDKNVLSETGDKNVLSETGDKNVLSETGDKNVLSETGDKNVLSETGDKNVLSETGDKNVLSETGDKNVLSETGDKNVLSETGDKNVLSETGDKNVLSETGDKNVLSETGDKNVLSETGERNADPVCEARPSDKTKIVILGGGPNRIGQGIEFDYCCCHACFALSDAGYETIMINCNPETVSTDYDTSDRLYFESLTAEDVLEIIHVEQSMGALKGVIVQFGGQTPLKLAEPLTEAGVPILGTSYDAIDLAEDRDRFKALVNRLGLKQPESGIAGSPAEARSVAERVGYPIVIRPSYVLGGRAMEILADAGELERYIQRLSAILDRPSELVVSNKRPLLIDRYLADATEVDVDCLSDDRDTFIPGIMEHIEEAGIHSGDSACSLPAHSLDSAIVVRIEKQTRDLARALNVIGLMNVQYAIKGKDIYILEVNPRASRTVPFVAKVVGLPIAGIAARIMAGAPLASFGLKPVRLTHVAVKEAVFPWARFPGVDTILGPEMRSTGEVMGIDRDFALAFAKSQIGSGTTLPEGGTVFVSVREADKDKILGAARELSDMGFRLIATRGTRRHLENHGIVCEQVNKVLEGRPHIVDVMKNGDVHLVFNTTEGAKALADSKDIRRTALLNRIPYYTTLAGAVAVTEAIKALKADTLKVAPLQSYVSRAS